MASITVVGLIPLSIYIQTTTIQFYQYLKEVNGFDVGSKEIRREVRDDKYC